MSLFFFGLRLGFVQSPLRPTLPNSLFFILKIVFYPRLLFPLSLFLKSRTEVVASPPSPLPGFVADLVGGPLAVPYTAVADFDTPFSVRDSALAHSVGVFVFFPVVYSLQAS